MVAVGLILYLYLDILSPIAPRLSKDRISSGAQSYPRTSPHPLRQSYNPYPSDKGEPSSKLRNSAPASTMKKIPEVQQQITEAKPLESRDDRPKRLTSLPPKSSVPNQPVEAPTRNPGEINDHRPSALSIDVVQAQTYFGVGSFYCLLSTAKQNV